MPYFNHYAMPLVSVLMPVYNGEKYIKEAIDSILCQTFTDFELLICNDASTDRSMDIVRQYRDSRIKVLENQTNSGIVYTRNKLFTEAQGTYLSIMDCDDIAQKQKLEKQVLFLENHPACGICGTWARKINENLETVGHIQMPEEDADIRVNLLFQSSFVQSSVVLRKKLLSDLLYRQEFPVAEDYDLWERLSHLTQMHNIPEFLLYYRWHQQNTSQNQENLLAQKRPDHCTAALPDALLHPYRITDPHRNRKSAPLTRFNICESGRTMAKKITRILPNQPLRPLFPLS